MSKTVLKILGFSCYFGGVIFILGVSESGGGPVGVLVLPIWICAGVMIALGFRRKKKEKKKEKTEEKTEENKAPEERERQISCSRCRKRFTADEMIYVDGEYFCTECFLKIQIQQRKKAE